jgi:hypothetical protein
VQNAVLIDGRLVSSRVSRAGEVRSELGPAIAPRTLPAITRAPARLVRPRPPAEWLRCGCSMVAPWPARSLVKFVDGIALRLQGTPLRRRPVVGRRAQGPKLCAACSQTGWWAVGLARSSLLFGSPPEQPDCRESARCDHRGPSCGMASESGPVAVPRLPAAGWPQPLPACSCPHVPSKYRHTHTHTRTHTHSQIGPPGPGRPLPTSSTWPAKHGTPLRATAGQLEETRYEIGTSPCHALGPQPCLLGACGRGQRRHMDAVADTH